MSNFFRSRAFKLVAGATAIGVGARGVYEFKKRRKSEEPSFIRSVKLNYDVPPTSSNLQVRQSFQATNKSKLHITLFQYNNCPFCCKVRAFLKYFGYAFDVIEVNSIWRKEIKWAKDYKKVPILVIRSEDSDPVVLFDSSVALSALSTLRLNPGMPLQEIKDKYEAFETVIGNTEGKADSSCRQKGSKVEFPNKQHIMVSEKEYTKNKSSFEDEMKWRKWGDDVFVHTVSPNIYRTFSESLATFQMFSEQGEWEKLFPTWQRYVIIYSGAFVMKFIGKRLQKRHNLDEDVRVSLVAASQNWTQALESKNTPYMGGNKPNLADISVYGYANSMYGSDAFKYVASKNSGFSDWYNMMETLINQRAGSELVSV